MVEVYFKYDIGQKVKVSGGGVAKIDYCSWDGENKYYYINEPGGVIAWCIEQDVEVVE